MTSLQRPNLAARLPVVCMAAHNAIRQHQGASYAALRKNCDRVPMLRYIIIESGIAGRSPYPTARTKSNR
jgi:hypothetical protein